MDNGDVIDLGSPCVHAHFDAHALRVRIDRVEKRNAMTQDMYRAVKRAAILADTEPDIDVLVLTGTDDVFCVGGDMGGNAIDDPTLSAEWDPTDHFPFRHLERCGAAVIAAINGLCYAGGLDIALHCDFVIAAESARFRAPEIMRGAPDVFMATRLADWVGVGNAKWIMFAMEPFDAARAQEMGLVQQVVPDDDFGDAVDAAVAAVARGGPGSRRAIKDDINRQLRPHDFRVFQRSIMNPEMREGMTAFLEKRDPVWPRD
ncbi:MAG: enoyl-CoA hydratase [Acidimicrobiales bacterium]|nr:MAG: enoyl-CoA hydratase [Acidimicrobiales bacterium]